MPVSVFNCAISGQQLLSHLKERFGGTDVITTTQFRNFFGFSMSTDCRMRKSGQYPRVLNLPGAFKEGRILLVDVAAWIEQGGCQKVEEINRKERGRPAGRKNRRKAEESLVMA